MSRRRTMASVSFVPYTGSAHVPQQIGKRADVVFVRVREHDTFENLRVIFHVGRVGQNQSSPLDARCREHESRVDEDHRVLTPVRHHVHPELTEAAQRQNLERAPKRPTAQPRLIGFDHYRQGFSNLVFRNRFNTTRIGLSRRTAN